MRLINTNTLELEDFSGQPPPYAILSHTWEEGEVTYHDFQNQTVRETQKGWDKILLTCRQAKIDELEYAWVDTCCIDKSSSAELSEAINSMFKWYRSSASCYAFLRDVALLSEDAGSGIAEATEDIDGWRSEFRASKWFTRGWTLQELIAPREVVFYDSSWTKIRNRTELTYLISLATGISAEVLCGEQLLSSISVAKRMNWASKRRTTREEDVAYCLMGIFDVNMPMLYGEGSKAFIRLQEEILKNTDDQSLYAWRATPESESETPYRGLLAASPAEFADCDDIIPFRNFSADLGTPTVITARGIPLTGRIKFSDTDAIGDRQALVGLNCLRGDDFKNIIAIRVVPIGGDQFLRYRPSRLFSLSSVGTQETIYVARFFQAANLESLPRSERQFAFNFYNLPEGVRVLNVYPRPTVKYDSNLGVIELGPWIKDKAIVELEVPWSEDRLILLLWAHKPMASREYQAAFLPSVQPNHPGYSFSLLKREETWINTFRQAKKPKEQVDNKTISEKIVSFGPNFPAAIITVQRSRVQGFDMFCVDIKRREPRQATVNKRIPSLYSVMRGAWK